MKKNNLTADALLAARTIIQDRGINLNAANGLQLDPTHVKICLYESFKQDRIDPMKLASSIDSNFLHDMLGLIGDWNLDTFTFDGLFKPRACK